MTRNFSVNRMVQAILPQTYKAPVTQQRSIERVKMTSLLLE